ncbi:MAG: hypothetical protein DCC55_37370 [Chloroflexi bacterium]|nr:MAG: hypothetical protein DCC55_37370 [Chloroflexota bacterium]
MNLDETQVQHVGRLMTKVQVPARPLLRTLHRLFVITLSGCLVILFAGGGAVTAQQASLQRLNMTVAGYGFDLLSWEVEALAAKAQALITRPAAPLTPAEGVALVQDYLERARQIRQLEVEIARLYSENNHERTPLAAGHQAEIEALRIQQAHDRPAVEQIIEQQVGLILVEAGLGLEGVPLPPVKFAFVEPPKKLVVSPRDRIETLYARMLDAAISLDTIELAEQRIRYEQELSAYVTNIGGLGAYPTMVIDDASLEWILSTVAHEWVHNYLTFFPLGFNYGASSDIIIINETVADIVGNEVGAEALRRFYPELVPPPPPAVNTETIPLTPARTFDFGANMRETRLLVDTLLAQGRVEEAERYMERRRQYFVANGYPLRVLNQAFFAFHGSYGTGAAATSPLGPQLERLRELTPDTKTFLQVVRPFTTPEDVAAALVEWESARQDNN